MGRLLGPLLQTGLPLIENVLKHFNTIKIHCCRISNRRSYSYENVWTWFYNTEISNEEMNDIMKKVKSLEESGLLAKVVSETIKNEGKEQKEGFVGILLGTLGASLSGNLLTGKGTIRVGEGTVRAGENF